MFRPVDFVWSPSEVDIGGTRQLLGAAGQAGVAHFLYISIVGVQHSHVPYLRLKAVAEDLVRQSAVFDRGGDTVLLAARPDARADGAPSGVAAAHALPMQLGDEGDFAAYVVECVPLPRCLLRAATRWACVRRRPPNRHPPSAGEGSRLRYWPKGLDLINICTMHKSRY
jgi:hypothetical protein